VVLIRVAIVLVVLLEEVAELLVMVAVLGAVSHSRVVLKVVETKVEVASAAEAAEAELMVLVEAVATVAALHLDGVSMALVADHM
jgi:hypothetical protein